jgi:hypothetical protein
MMTLLLRVLRSSRSLTKWLEGVRNWVMVEIGEYFNSLCIISKGSAWVIQDSGQEKPTDCVTALVFPMNCSEGLEQA